MSLCVGGDRVEEGLRFSPAFVFAAVDTEVSSLNSTAVHAINVLAVVHVDVGAVGDAVAKDAVSVTRLDSEVVVVLVVQQLR